MSAKGTRLKAENGPKYSFSIDIIIMCASYLVTFSLVYFSYQHLIKPLKYDPLIQGGLLDLIAVTLIFIFCFIFDSSSIYDPYWGLAPIPLSIFWAMFSPEPYCVKNILTIFSVTFYGLRYQFQYFRAWPGLNYVDFRYQDFKESAWNNRLLFWISSYLGYNVIPALFVFVGMIPVYYILQAQNIDSILFYIGIAITIGAAILEHVADEQLHQFKSKNKDQYIDEGFWKYSRHPNYLGEILVWWGLYVVNLGTDGTTKYTWVGAFAMYLLFDMVTIPTMENHLLQTRPNYVIQQRRLKKLMFWFRNEKSAREYKATLGKSK